MLKWFGPNEGEAKSACRRFAGPKNSSGIKPFHRATNPNRMMVKIGIIVVTIFMFSILLCQEVPGTALEFQV